MPHGMQAIGLGSPAVGMAVPMLQVEAVSKRFATPEGDIVTVDGVSFDVRRGEFVPVIGPSGCGKSTLFGMIDGLERRFPHEISGGMRQRTAIARTVAYAPDILMLDEPFGALDEQIRLLLGDTVQRIQSELKRFVDIDLPRPHRSEDVGDPRSGRLVAEIWRDLRDEASRGLRDQERG